MSVLRINQNPVAVNANRNLKMTGMAIAKSMERLSSGLRINRAADDAAGLSISEKLRGQIRGLNRASSNSLDGISLIQTAEGALNEVHSILQRTRELSVQAANGIYTSGDRQAIQAEVTQLVDEINRISKTTEFNTKTLLDGTMGALISTDDYTRVRAAVVGNVGDGGSFVLKAVAKSTGQLQVQKTDVFTTTGSGDSVGQLNYLHTLRADATVKTAGADGIGNTGVYKIEVVNDANGSVAVQSATSGTLRISGASIAGGGLSLGRNLQAEELTDGDEVLLTVNTASGVQTISVVLPSMGTTNTVFAANISTALGGLVSAVGFTGGRFSINGAAGSFSIINTEFVDVDGSGSDFHLSFSGNGRSNYMFSSVQVSFFNNGSSTSALLQRAAGSTGGHFSIGTANTGTINIRLDTRFDYGTVTAANTTLSDEITWNKNSGGNSLQDYGKVWSTGALAENATVLVSAISARTYAVFEFDNHTYQDKVASGWDSDAAIAAARGSRVSNANGSTTTSISETFGGAAGSLLENVRVTFDGILQAGETATFNMSSNSVLTADQKNTLASLSRFQQFGVFNGRNSVEFTLYQRGVNRSATVNLSKNDSLEDMAGKISLAMWAPDGDGLIQSGIINPDEVPDLVHVNTIGEARGTLSITTAIPGAEIVFSGDESLLKALSLVEVQEGKAPIFSVSAFKVEKNELVGSVEVDSNEINGLLPGLRIFFDNTAGLRLDPQPPAESVNGSNNMTSFGYMKPFERPQVSLSGEVSTMFVHVAPRDFTLQIGANQGQTISSFIGDMSAEALGVEGLLVVDSELAQEAISIVDQAINRVSNQRSRLGAIQNRLESTIRNLDVAAENLTASESRIRDADVAAETIGSTRNQILLQAGTAALAQANQLPQSVLQLIR